MFFYQRLPGEKVKIFSSVTKRTYVISKKEFEAEKMRSASIDCVGKDGKLRTLKSNILWVEHTPGDLVHNYKTDSGFQFSLGRTKK